MLVLITKVFESNHARYMVNFEGNLKFMNPIKISYITLNKWRTIKPMNKLKFKKDYHQICDTYRIDKYLASSEGFIFDILHKQQ